MNSASRFIFLSLLFLHVGCDSKPPAPPGNPKVELGELYKAGKALQDAVQAAGNVPEQATFLRLQTAFKDQIQAVDGRPEKEKKRLSPFATRYAKVDAVYDMAAKALDLSLRLEKCRMEGTPRVCREKFDSESNEMYSAIIDSAALRGACRQCDPTSKGTVGEIFARALEMHATADQRLLRNMP